MTATQRKQTSAVRIAARVADLIEKAGLPRVSMFDLAPVVTGWAKAGESLRKRYENECSYEWADTDAYRTGTERAEAKLIESVKAAGLFAFIQGDPRGATLYVDSSPIPADNYTTAVCVCL